MNTWIDLLLHIVSMPQATIEEIDKNLPGFALLADDVTELDPFVRQAAPHVEALAPIVIKAWPILTKAWPHLVAVAPTVEDVIKFVESKKQGD